ncbi:hypothetical protein BCR32DRAFT_127733 [Anaeromyces robustus]|uniref:Uncharacterized protein n=1 Tax=Anaeromyces robustus TaxID=1754192 RepID=A0A1Y1VUW5_9FUNG|nr:hypothetical protein BCR32DRAFT_127733 [Anaeromyces robustus]|eukprot:ORX64554.1 hypothetical protein BCR32DRAFT_127733 [Anaeromyces robustus]
MILCWIIKLFRNNTIYSICWKFINILYSCIKYLKNKLVQKTIEASKIIEQQNKKLPDELKTKKRNNSINSEKTTNNISNYINKALLKYDSKNLLDTWTLSQITQKEGSILKRKKKFNKNQALYYKINQHNLKHNKDKHTLYTNFLDFQNDRGFKSLTIQKNIRKKIKMIQIIKDIKDLKTTSLVSPTNKNKKRKVEMKRKSNSSSVTSYFNNTLNFVIKNLINNNVDSVSDKKKMHLFGAEANIDFHKHTLIIYNKKNSELNYIPKKKENIVKKVARLNEIDQLIIYNNDESGWFNILTNNPISKKYGFILL